MAGQLPLLIKNAAYDKLNHSYTRLVYLHFGDIDPDGFLILEHLNQNCGIEANPVYMGIEELEKYNSYVKQLTDNDRKKTEKLISQGKHINVLKYMLEKNIKLEQEIVAYSEMNERFD